MSLLRTQEAVFAVQAELRQVRERLQELERRLEAARARHREQIARSLTSPDPLERTRAESVAQWWEVHPVSIPFRSRQ